MKTSRILLILFIFAFSGSYHLSLDLFSLDLTQSPSAIYAAPAPQKSPGTEMNAKQEIKTKKRSNVKQETIFQLIIKGGWTMAGLGLIAAAILGLILERFYFFRSKRTTLKGFSAAISRCLDNADSPGNGLKSVIDFLQSDDRLISKILLAGMNRSSEGAEKVEKAIESSASSEIGSLERGLNLLANLGNIAPLLGFFGTVIGMRASFLQFVAKAAPTARDLAGGVEEALITTAAGLLIAIPAHLIHNLFVYNIDSLSIETERNAERILAKLR